MDLSGRTRANRQREKTFFHTFYINCQQTVWPMLKVDLPTAKHLDYICQLIISGLSVHLPISNYSIKTSLSKLYPASWVLGRSDVVELTIENSHQNCTPC